MENQFDLPHKGKHALTDMWSYQKLGGGEAHLASF